MKGFCGECDRRYACDIDPDKCDEWPDPVPMTNADRIRAMSDEELAVWLCGLFSVFTCYTHCPGFDLCNDSDEESNGLKKWLQQPAGEEGKHENHT